MGRRSGLGKGLGALIPAGEQPEYKGPELREIPVGSIEPNPVQPRAYFDEESLQSLTASVQEVGVLQPVLVRSVGHDQYELIAGERRWRAATRAGLATIPALVRDAEGTQTLEHALVENLHREDLNPLEEAAAYQQLIDDFGSTQDDVARRVGKSRSAVANTIRLLHLAPSVQRLVADRRLSAGHARALLSVPDSGFQEELAELAVSEELTVREVEDLVRRHVGGDREDDGGQTRSDPGSTQAREPGGDVPAAGILEVQNLLAAHLDTRVRVQVGAKRGRLTIEFATVDDLARISRVIVEGPEGTQVPESTQVPGSTQV